MPENELAIADLEPGMVVAHPIVDQKGRIIIPESTRLTPMHIARLEKWGITKVSVRGVEATSIDEPAGGAENGRDEKPLASNNAEEQEFMRRVAAQVAARFSNLPETPINQELRKLTIKHLVLNGRGVVPGLK